MYVSIDWMFLMSQYNLSGRFWDWYSGMTHLERKRLYASWKTCFLKYCVQDDHSFSIRIDALNQLARCLEKDLSLACLVCSCSLWLTLIHLAVQAVHDGFLETLNLLLPSTEACYPQLCGENNSRTKALQRNLNQLQEETLEQETETDRISQELFSTQVLRVIDLKS